MIYGDHLKLDLLIFTALDRRLTHVVGWREISREYSGLQSSTSFGSARCDGPAYRQTILKLSYSRPKISQKGVLSGGRLEFQRTRVGTERNHP
jgi:hypothetical protein